VVEAFILVKVGPEYKRETAKALLKVEGVKEVCELTGDIDVLLRVEAFDMEELSKIVFKVRELGGIQETDTRMVLSALRR